MSEPFHSDSNVVRVRGYLTGLQARIIAALENLEGEGGERAVTDPWRKEPGEALQGDGITRIIEGGRVFERAGCGFSHVRGPRLPPSATQHRPELAGAPFEAMGVSLVFHAGTELKDGVPHTSGGRVLCVTVLADSVKQAQQRVYDVARGIHFDGAQYRHDIGHRAVKANG